MHRQGLTVEDAKKKYMIEEDFPYFLDNRTDVILSIVL